jgi:hypothetical protein
MCEVGDDHLENLWRKLVPRMGVIEGIWNPSCERALEFGFGTVPKNTGNALDSCDRKSNEKVGAKDTKGFVRYLIVNM